MLTERLGISPGITRMVTQHLASFLDREQGLIFPDLATYRYSWEDLRQQLPTGTAHDRIRGSDNESLRSCDLGFQAQAAALRHITCIHVTPQIPFAQMGIGGKRRKALVIRWFHNVGETQSDEGNSTPAMKLPCHLFAEHL